MKLLDHSEMSADQLATARSYAKLLNAIGADLNQVMSKHGLSDMQIHGFSFKKKTTGASFNDRPHPTGIGVTADGIWEAKSY